MGKYLDLSLLIDAEPPTSEVLSLVEDKDLQDEFQQRLDGNFFRSFIKDYCTDADIDIIIEVMEEVTKEVRNAD